jgi:hypothetical protein
MNQDQFVLEEAGEQRLRTRDSLTGVRFTFVIKDKKFDATLTEHALNRDHLIPLYKITPANLLCGKPVPYG